MKTPQYSLRQTATDILVSIRCPYIRQSELEYIIADTTFRFYCNPYFLLLEFNTPIGTEKSCSYCVDTGMVEIAIAKHDDAWLPDLDLLTLLKQPAVNPTLNANPSLNPLIEQVEPPKTKDDGLGEQGAPLEFDWLVEQDIQPENVHSTKYGFNNLYHGHAADIYMVANECIEIADIDNLTPSEKRAERIAIENEKFDPDYYIADYLNAEDIQDVLRFKPSTYSALKRVQTHKEPEYADPFLKFSEYENELMMRLANKECTQVANLDLFDHDSLRQAYLGMVDILFAYAFNHRLFMGDNSVESAYPLYRSYALAEKVMKDVVIVLKLGKRALLKCFLEIKTILARDDCMYVLDKIWINDYCIWIQRADDKQIAALATELHHYKIEKEQVGWNLEELERNSLEVKNGAMENDDIDQNINDADSERNAANSEFILPKTENVAVSAESVGNLDDPNANRGERESEAKLARYFGIQELS